MARPPPPTQVLQTERDLRPPAEPPGLFFNFKILGENDSLATKKIFL